MMWELWEQNPTSFLLLRPFYRNILTSMTFFSLMAIQNHTGKPYPELSDTASHRTITCLSVLTPFASWKVDKKDVLCNQVQCRASKEFSVPQWRNTRVLSFLRGVLHNVMTDLEPLQLYRRTRARMEEYKCSFTCLSEHAPIWPCHVSVQDLLSSENQNSSPRCSAYVLQMGQATHQCTCYKEIYPHVKLTGTTTGRF